MNILTIVMVFFSILGAIDYILNNKFGIGKEWERGFHLLGTMALTMVGMLVLAPFMAYILEPVLRIISEKTPFDPSVFAGMLLANDMGASSLALGLAKTEQMGYFNGLIVGAMMGCTISFTLPFALGVVESKQHRELLLGLMFGIVTIPIGCFVSGLMIGIPVFDLFMDLIPLILLAILLAIALLKKTEGCIKAFHLLGVCIRIIITIGLVVGIIASLTGYELLPHIAPIEEGALVIFNAAIVMSGSFPCIHVISKLLRKPLQALAGKIGVNETATMGIVASMASSSTTFGIMKNMDKKGVVLNSAFAVSGAFAFASHLAFTISIEPSYVPSMIVGKLVSGGIAVIVALILYPKLNKFD